MEDVEVSQFPQPVEIQTEDIQNECESAENFQKFIYDLFDKNGILNDLRAYLRGHIVNVLKSAQTGDPPICQRHFTQRLELTSQALNILVAEYLLRFEFSYSLSVFVSEIPLANMVFDFSKSLMQNSNETTGLRFKESDVWSVLNYLGIKCDSEHASSIVEMYKTEKQTPLLLCILKCLPMYRKTAVNIEQDSSSNASQSLSERSSEHTEDNRRNRRDKCSHYSSCKNCQHRVKKVREKYKRKKKEVAKQETSLNPLNGETLMKNINCMERSLIDEMFHHLKNVYEKEVDMVREEEEGTVKRSLASHALVLQKRQDEMEEAFAVREAELERSVQQKKRFLWGLARALRDQHQNMARAMRAVRHESDRLSAKEESLKDQLIKAEEILRKRGEEMRKQISNELVILEDHLESMKSERDTIHRERSELEQLKSACETNTKALQINNIESGKDIQNHYDMLKNELAILKKYLEVTKLEPKCVIERGTLTDLSNVSSKISIVLNNEQDVEKYVREDIRPPNQVINDFKKQKNVNFSQSNLDEVFGEASRGGSRSTLSSEADELRQLREENQQLKMLANQQRSQLEAAAARLRAARSPGRPRTAPVTHAHPHAHAHPLADPDTNSLNLIASANSLHWRGGEDGGGPAYAAGPGYGFEAGPIGGATGPCGVATGPCRVATGPCRVATGPCGAGEQLRSWPCAAPRVMLPGEPLPFIDTMPDTRADSRRHLISQWRSLRLRRPAGVAKLRAPHSTDAHKSPQQWAAAAFRKALVGASSAAHDLDGPTEGSSRTPDAEAEAYLPTDSDKRQNRFKNLMELENCNAKNREKSPKSVLREAKEKLRNSNIKCQPPSSREKSPTAVLREAKLRLRKLEIEAEAVEKSYRDFRKRQSELRGERTPNSQANEEAVVTKDIGDLGLRRSKSLQKVDKSDTNDPLASKYKDPVETLKSDFDKYFREYHKTMDMGETRFKNKNSAAQQAKPIPKAFSPQISKENEQRNKPGNYIETPLAEFRKLYQPLKPATKTEDNVSHETKQRVEKKDSIPKSQKAKPQIPPTSALQKNEPKSKQLEARKEAIIKTQNEKKAELEILKQNISKMYNLQQPINTEVPPRQPVEVVIQNEHSHPIREGTTIENDKNVLRIEIESVKEVNEVQVPNIEPQNLLVVVQSEVDATDVVPSESEPEGEKMSVNMTILISPKKSNQAAGINIDLERSTPIERSRRSESPEQAAMLTRNDVLNAIFHADTMKETSSHDMRTEIDASKEHVGDYIINEAENHNYDYVDDFTADVDNLNSHYSRSDYDNLSPVSIQKTSEDENFWDN